jgi:hypothetical protein
MIHPRRPLPPVPDFILDVILDKNLDGQKREDTLDQISKLKGVLSASFNAAVADKNSITVGLADNQTVKAEDIKKIIENLPGVVQTRFRCLQ